jgi:thiol-disulfide isomerase/thioredoxin
MHPDSLIDDEPRRSRALPLLLLLVTAAICVFIWTVRMPPRESEASHHPAVGKKVSDFKLESLLNTESPVRFSQLQGRVVLLNFWGPWCGPCLMELPEILDLEKKYADDKRVAILLVASTQDGSGPEELKTDAEETLSKFKNRAPNYHDETDAAKSVLVRELQLNQFGFPFTVLFDQAGKVRAVWMGATETGVSEMASEIEKLLKADR